MKNPRRNGLNRSGGPAVNGNVRSAGAQTRLKRQTGNLLLIAAVVTRNSFSESRFNYGVVADTTSQIGDSGTSRINQSESHVQHETAS